MWWISYWFYLVHSIFKGKNSINVISLKKNFITGLHSDIYTPISFKLCMMVEIKKIYIWIPVWMTLTFIQGHSCMRNQKLLSTILEILQFGWNLLSFHNLLVCGSSCQIYFVQVESRQRTMLTWFYKRCVRTFVNWFVSNLVWCQTWSNSTVWFQFGWRMFSQGNRVMRKLELVQSVKKSCNYGQYGL